MDDVGWTVFKWVLDTRPLWPAAMRTSDLMAAAARALALVGSDEASRVLRYYFVKDAKLALASALLKRLAIARFGGVSWAEAAGWTRDHRAKPVFRRARDDAEPLRFNVSHQAGLVAFVAIVGLPPRPPFSVSDADADADADDCPAVGVDVVCPRERCHRDLAMVAADGWPGYVAIHADVFAPAEAAALKALAPVAPLPPGDPVPANRPCSLSAAPSAAGDLETDRRLAYFYALWCLREAYVKMTGHALFAPWLRDLEMRYFAPVSTDHALPPRPLEIWFGGRLVRDVHMRLEALTLPLSGSGGGDDFVICTAVRCLAEDRPRVEAQVARPFTSLSLDDVLAEAETCHSQPDE